jgi:hypothetical protein
MNRKRVAIAIAGAAALSVVSVCCIRHGEEAERVHGAATAGDSVAQATPDTSPIMAEALTSARDAAVRDPAARDAAAHEPAAPKNEDNAVARAMRATDAHDRALLADLERQTKKAPPPAVHTLLGLRRQGASRAELERFIAEQLARDLVVRMLATRWLNAHTAPHGGAQPASPKPILRSTDGPRQLKPIEPTRQEVSE